MQSVLEFEVHEVHQTSGGYDHVVIFSAHVLLSDDPTIDVWSEPPLVGFSDRSPERQALHQIKLGITDALASRGWGAAAQISGLTLHPTDFDAEMFRRYTCQALTDRIDRLF